MGQGFGDAALAGDATWASNVHDTSSWNSAGNDFVVAASTTPFVDGNTVPMIETAPQDR
ncbi:MAG: hypothetical protein GWQ05_17120 [Verrucomicrobiaceae bacterium]|nr:hypothetical protein [Verrucomicrobiaceae bacterium]NCF92654.1 hypothetical protein [Verrucomicrobiaceae bacterium]